MPKFVLFAEMLSAALLCDCNAGEYEAAEEEGALALQYDSSPNLGCLGCRTMHISHSVKLQNKGNTCRCIAYISQPLVPRLNASEALVILQALTFFQVCVLLQVQPPAVKDRSCRSIEISQQPQVRKNGVDPSRKPLVLWTDFRCCVHSGAMQCHLRSRRLVMEASRAFQSGSAAVSSAGTTTRPGRGERKLVARRSRDRSSLHSSI